MKWQALFGIGLSIVLGAFVLTQMDFDRLGTAFQTAQYRFVILAALVQISTHLVRAVRWGYLFEAVKPVSLGALVSATAIGFMANMVLPAHAGEVVKAYVISRREQVSTMTALATIVMERMGDLVTMVCILLLVLVTPGLPLTEGPLAAGLRIGGYSAVGLGALLIGSLWYLHTNTAHMLRLLAYPMRCFPSTWRTRLLQALTSFAAGLQTFRQGRHLLLVLGLSLLLWALIGFSNWLVLRAFGLHLPIVAAFFILVIQVLSVSVPSGPGYIGTFHAAVVAGLGVFHLAPELALTLAIMMHATFFFPFIVIGIGFLWGESLSLRDLSAAQAHSLKS
jgi:hypothetical protein